MLIGILQTGLAPEPLVKEFGEYPDMFAKLLAGNDFGFRTYAVVNGSFPASVAECDGWLITGSRHGAYEDHPWIPPLEEFIRNSYAAGVPMVGICFGHQIIAQAMGGKVEKFAGGWATGATDYDFDGKKVKLNAWHQDQVVTKPAMAKVIASNDFCSNAALLYDDRMLTLQAHPEYGANFINGLVETRGRGVVPEDVLSKTRAHLSDPLDSQPMAEKIAAFFKARHPATPVA